MGYARFAVFIVEFQFLGTHETVRATYTKYPGEVTSLQEHLANTWKTRVIFETCARLNDDIPS